VEKTDGKTLEWELLDDDQMVTMSLKGARFRLC